MTKRRVYVDNAATTPVHPQVMKEMLPYFTIPWQPVQYHSFGRQANAMDKAREESGGPGATDEVFFTGSGTEADNWAERAWPLNKGRAIIL